MNGLFVVTIGHEEETGTFVANVLSAKENKGQSLEAQSLKALMAAISKSVRKRQSHNLRFPPPEPSKIIKPNGFSAPHALIVPARN